MLAIEGERAEQEVAGETRRVLKSSAAQMLG